jgi:hypothetical protein
LGEVLSDCGTPAAGIVDADALPASEKPSPAAPSAVKAAVVGVCFFEACLTLGMVASSKILARALDAIRVRSANPARYYLGYQL